MISKAVRIYRSEGLQNLVIRSTGYVYRKTIRNVLPITGQPKYNGVEVVGKKYYSNTKPAAKRRLFDGFLPVCFHRSIDPDKEGGLVAGHSTITRPGDTVLIVGGGWGVTMGRAANIVGDSGRVIVFEGSDEHVEDLHRVAEFNNIESNCVIHHAVVGVDTAIWGGEKPDSPVTPPAELPDCDVLEMDCQGAEFEVLLKLAMRPRAMIIEVHPRQYQEDLDSLTDLLDGLGYEITHHFDHDGVPVSADVFEEMYEIHLADKQLNMEGLRSPPVIVAEKESD